MKAEPTLVRLAQAELQLLMQFLGIETLPGIAADLLPEMNAEQRAASLAVAEQTLRARHFIRWGNDAQRAVDPWLANLFLDYARPHSTLFVDTALSGTRAMPFLYVSGQQGIYEQCQPEPGVLQLRVLNDSAELEQRLFPRLAEMKPREPACWQGRISQKLLNEVLPLVSHDERTAQRRLASVLPAELAVALVAAYREPRVVQYLACWLNVPTREHSEPRSALTILLGTQHAFLLWKGESERGITTDVDVELFSVHALRAYIKQLAFPLTRDVINHPHQ